MPPGLEGEPLALELGPRVDRQRRWLVRLDIRLVVGPVEDEVGREVDQRRALAPARAGHVEGALRVDRKRQVGF